MARRFARKVSFASVVTQISPLERRVLMSASGLQLGSYPAVGKWEAHTDTPYIQAAATAAATGTSVVAASAPLSAVPVLSSRPGAAAKIYLDFDGDTTVAWGSYNPGTTPAYDTDGNASNFSDAELANINEIWARVAEKYSPFNVDVTTVNPGTFADRGAIHMVIGGAGAWLGAQAGGVAYVGSFANSAPNTGFIFDDNLGNGTPKYVAEATAHEAGHTFGLSHQAAWSGTTLTAEYSSGDGVDAPIMGNSYSARRGLWWNGVTSASSTSAQADLSILTNTTNAFGYRADGFGSSIAAASTLSLNGTTVNAKSGVIEKTSDADVFSFTTGAGTVNLTAAVPVLGAMLDAKLTLIDSAGNTLAVADTSALGESLSATVGAGTYYVSVASHGGYGDVGTYTLTGTVAAQAVIQPLAAPSGLSATAASSTVVNLAWADNSADETGFALQRSTDNGVSWTTIANVAANTSGYTDATAAGTTYAYRVQAVDSVGSRVSTWSNSASVTTPSAPVVVTATPATPTTLYATTLSRSSIRLNWTDNATNETGVKVYMSSNNGLTWSLRGTAGANATTVNITGLSANTVYRFKVRATNSMGDSPDSNIAATRTSNAYFSAAFSQTAGTSLDGSKAGQGYFSVKPVAAKLLEAKKAAYDFAR